MEIALNSTKSKFIGLSTALCATIPIMELVKKLKGQSFDMVFTQPMVHCHVFEDNRGALEIAKVPKMCPCTKHINVKFHHFNVKWGKITLHAINTHNQPADMLTKPLATLTHVQHCAIIMVGVGKAMLRGSVKIFILVAVSNAMNLWEILLVPSLPRALVPGPYAKSHSASLDLQQSGQT